MCVYALGLVFSSPHRNAETHLSQYMLMVYDLFYPSPFDVTSIARYTFLARDLHMASNNGAMILTKQ